MKWTDIPSGQTNGAFQRFMVSLGKDAGVAVNRINNEPAFVKRLARYAIDGCITPNASHDEAKEIMGKNFFGIPEAMKYFGVNPTRRQLAMFSEIPFTTEDLVKCRDTYVLVAPLLSIIEVRKKVEVLFKSGPTWYDNEDFINDSVETGWQLIKKTPIIDSKNTWEGKQRLVLSNGGKIPTAPLIIYTIAGFWLMTGVQLFKETPIVTSTSNTGPFSFLEKRILVECHKYDNDKLFFRSCSNERCAEFYLPFALN